MDILTSNFFCMDSTRSLLAPFSSVLTIASFCTIHDSISSHSLIRLKNLIVSSRFLRRCYMHIHKHTCIVNTLTMTKPCTYVRTLANFINWSYVSLMDCCRLTTALDASLRVLYILDGSVDILHTHVCE